MTAEIYYIPWTQHDSLLAGDGSARIQVGLGDLLEFKLDFRLQRLVSLEKMNTLEILWHCTPLWSLSCSCSTVKSPEVSQSGADNPTSPSLSGNRGRLGILGGKQFNST